MIGIYKSLVANKDERYRGLSGRFDLKDDQGMLFIFPTEEPQDFCMRDCYIPIDIAFIDSDMMVVKIHEMQVERDHVGRKTYSSEKPVLYALEVKGGLFAKLAIREGDKVTFSGTIPKGRN